MNDFEKLGVFYLGRVFDPQAGQPTGEPVLYDSRDLTTHAVCVGMTGSGKTGLCVSLLEEASIDGIPAIAIDPKGDLGNLLLQFPELRAEDFRPWIDPADAGRKGLSVDQLAGQTAEKWRQGLAEWGQDAARIARLRDAADFAIYTPGSSAGLSLSVLRSLGAPPEAVAADPDALRERVAATVSGLLALVGVQGDPLRSREHILLANIVERAWREGRAMGIVDLVREVQTPPYERIGALDVESFFPTRERAELALSLNNLLAAPAFAAWMDGEPLDVQRLLWTPEGKPRISILSIAHLSDAERMFFVTLLLNEVIAWMRAQPGTSSLRALLYMDEVFGFFPPVANPPSKPPMLTLLKQARAFGLGVVLATQNPVDLDYKGLSNAGTWLLGRLQTEQDKQRVLDGLESAAAGAKLDRAELDRLLSDLGQRVFLMNNVHDDQPVLLQTRWALSFLAGPLTRAQIQTLMAPRKSAAPRQAAPRPVAAASPESAPRRSRPVLPAGIAEFFLPLPAGAAAYAPALYGAGKLRFVEVKAKVDAWAPAALLAPLGEPVPPDPWDQAQPVDPASLDLLREPDGEASFTDLPAAVQPKNFALWQKSLAGALHRTQTLELWSCPELRLLSAPGEAEGDFRVRVRESARAAREEKLDALKKKYAPRLAALSEQVRRAEERVAREKAQYDQQKLNAAVSVGATLLGALLGRRGGGVGSVGRAATAARGFGRAAQQKDDVERAAGGVGAAHERLEALESEFQAEVAALQADAGGPTLEKITVRPRKSDIQIDQVAVVWTPIERGR